MSHSGTVVGSDGNKRLDNGSKVAYEAIQGSQGMEAKNVSMP